MTISLFGSFTPVPAAGGSQIAPGPITLVPPGSMASGDLAWVYSSVRDGVAITNSADGGQTWTAETQDGAYRIFWCIFNGTWTADPTFTASGSTDAFTTVGHVWRGASDLALDVSLAVGAISSGAGVKTIPAITTLTDGALAVAGWGIPAIEDWSSLTGGWSTAGTQDHTNTGGNDGTLSVAYKVQASAGTTGDVAQTSANGFDAGRYSILAFKEAGGLGAIPTLRSRAIPLERLADSEDHFPSELIGPAWWCEALA